MKRQIIFAGALAVIFTSASVEAGDYLRLLGTAVSPATSRYADREVVITPEIRAVNIVHFDTIKFVSGNESFIWKFDGVSTLSTIKLSKIAPPGILDHEVTVYIAKSPKDLDGAH